MRLESARSRIIACEAISFSHIEPPHSPFTLLSLRPADNQRRAFLMRVSTDTVTQIGHLEMQLCQKSALAVADLTKSIYSCKNVIYKGRRKQLLAELLAPGSVG